MFADASMLQYRQVFGSLKTAYIKGLLKQILLKRKMYEVVKNKTQKHLSNPPVADGVTIFCDSLPAHTAICTGMGGVLAYPKLGVILVYWKQTGVLSPKNPTGGTSLPVYGWECQNIH